MRVLCCFFRRVECRCCCFGRWVVLVVVGGAHTHTRNDTSSLSGIADSDSVSFCLKARRMQKRKGFVLTASASGQSSGQDYQH